MKAVSFELLAALSWHFKHYCYLVGAQQIHLWVNEQANKSTVCSLLLGKPRVRAGHLSPRLQNWLVKVSTKTFSLNIAEAVPVAFPAQQAQHTAGTPENRGLSRVALATCGPQCCGPDNSQTFLGTGALSDILKSEMLQYFPSLLQ